MKALILAAGLGTRLMPLTAKTPKALIRIKGVTLLELAVRKVAREGFTDIMINVHHHASMVKEFLEQQHFSDVSIAISDESDQLLDTGGAILKTRKFLEGNEPFLVHNVDVVSNISLRELLRIHLEMDSLATLSVLDRKTKRYFLFDDSLRLRGWTDTSTGDVRWSGIPFQSAKPLAFSGIHIVSPKIFNLVNEKGRFSIISAYLDLAREHPIYGSLQTGKTWFDLGKPDQLHVIEGFLNDHPEFLPE